MSDWLEIFDEHGPGVDLIHDQGKPLCFVGLGAFNRCYSDILKNVRASSIVSLEDLDNQPTNFFQDNQFICLTSDIALKKKITAKVSEHGGEFFSIVGRANVMDSTVKIGRGSLVINYNLFFDHSSVGDHCMVMSCTQLAHRAVIQDYCHVSGYCHVSCCTIGEGCAVGLRSSVVGKPWNMISIADHCNILSGSVVSKSITEPGTYLGNRRSSKESSLDIRIL